MENYTGALIIIGACVVVLAIGFVRKKAEFAFNFFLRAVMGTLTIYLVNQVLISNSLSIGVGINPISVVTSGALGLPGLLLLYGINIYKFL